MMNNVTTRQFVSHPYVSLTCVLVLWFVLPQLGTVALMFGSALLLSVIVAEQPEHFRSRSGSLALAIGLVVAMWAATAIVLAMSMMGAITN